MGVVYRAVEPALGRPVAIKVLKLESVPSEERDELRLRFLQEARSAAAIQHPGAVTIYRVGETKGKPFIAMEWLDGETLAQVLARDGVLETGRAIDIALQVLSTLQAAHDVGVIHRDIKPANLIVSASGRVKVADFGIARFRKADLVRTEAGVLLGTPAFASPEQVAGEEVDARSDLYSLGTVVYQMLAGRLPFEAANMLEWLSKTLRESPAPLGSLRPDLSAGLTEVVMKALARERAERWSSANEMARALQENVPGQSAPGAAGEPPGAAERATMSMPQTEGGPVYRGVPAQLPLAVAHLVLSWPAQNVPPQPIPRLLDRLLTTPLHTEAFSGALVVGKRVLLIHDGRVLAGIDRRTGQTGNEVASALGVESGVQLHPVPASLPPRTLEILAGLLGSTRTLQKSLDASIVHLPGLAQKLAGECFSGVLHLDHGDDEGWVVMVEGKTVLAFYAGSWEGVLVEQSWTSWGAHVPLTLDIQEVEPRPLELTWSLRLRDFEIRCKTQSGPSPSRATGGFASSRLPSLARRAGGSESSVVLDPARSLDGGADDWLDAPPTHLLRWLLGEGAAHFADPKTASRWKYLAEWLPQVHRARLYAQLPGGSASEAERFDLVTLDEGDKVLHLARRFSRIEVGSFRRALSAVIAAKEAHLETGAIGGVVFVAPAFPPDVLSLYLETIESHATGLKRLQESLTGYAGFVRVGPRRGFHLLLVEENAGSFSPLDL